MGKLTYRGTLIITLFLLGMLATLLPMQAEAAGKVVVTGKYVNVRASGNTKSATLSKVYQGETYQIIKESGGWYYIGLKSGQKGWVAGWLVKTADTKVVSPTNIKVVPPVANTKATTQLSTNINQTVKVTVFPFQAKITGSSVNLRAGNTLTAKVLKKLTRNTKVSVLAQKADWFQIKAADGTKGWVASWLLKAEVPKTSTTAGTSTSAGTNTSAGTTQNSERVATVNGSTVNVRSGPSTSYAVAGKTVKGEQVMVLDGKQDWLKVRLANGSIGWIANWLVTQKVQVVKVEETTQKPVENSIPVAEPVSNTNPQPNLIDYRIETATETLVSISGKEALDYETSEQHEPHQLIIKLKNASILGNDKESSLNDGQGLLKVTAHKMEGINPEVVITLELEPDVKWVARPGETTKALILTRELASEDSSNGNGQAPNTPSEQGTTPTIRTVTIDAGHGGIDPGAVGPSKLQEKNVVFDISMKLGRKLVAAGYRVVYTREDDTKISLTRRPAIAAENNSDIFISVHANSSENPLTHGTSTYYYAPASDPVLSAQASERRRLAETVQAKMVAAVGRKDLGILQANFAVLRGTTMPSILVETAYLCNREEEALLAQAYIRDEFATAILEGVNQYFQESPAQQPIDNQIPSILQ